MFIATLVALLPDLAERATLQPVQDTYLDRTYPDQNYGREGVLQAGNGRVILIQFPALNYARIGEQSVANATLTLYAIRQSDAELVKISRIRKPWNEGPGRSVRHDLKEVGEMPPAWGYPTWTHAQVPKLSWSNGGAGAPQDAEVIEGATLVKSDGVWKITGLGSAVQAMIDNPLTNYGFRIEFSKDASFFSSEFTQSRPELEVQYQPVTRSGPDIEILYSVPQLTGQSWPAEGDTINWRIGVRNRGSEPAAGISLAITMPDGELKTQQTPQQVAPGSVAHIEVPLPWHNDHKDHRKFVVGFQAAAAINDQNPANGALQVPMNGLAIGFKMDPDDVEILANGGSAWPALQDKVAQMNQHVLPGSKYLFAPEGSTERLRLVDQAKDAWITVDLTALDGVEGKDRNIFILTQLARALTPLNEAFAKPGVEVARAYYDIRNHLGWLPDTRDEGFRLPGIPLPAEHWTPRIPETFPSYENGLLSRTEVGFLRESMGLFGKDRLKVMSQIPQGVAVRAFNGVGLPLSDAKIEVFQPIGSTMPANPVFMLESKASGIVYLGPQQIGGKATHPFGEVNPDGSNSWLLFKATRAGETAYAWLPVWKLWDWAFRSNMGIATVEMRFMLPDKPLDRGENLASGKLISSSMNLTPAELTSLVDSSKSTFITLAPGEWIEIDTGRDRAFGEVQLSTIDAPFDKFVMSTLRTGQNTSQLLPWYTEQFGAYRAAAFGTQDGTTSTVVYRANSTSARFLRITNLGEEPVKISDIDIIPTKIGE